MIINFITFIVFGIILAAIPFFTAWWISVPDTFWQYEYIDVCKHWPFLWY